MTVMQPFGPTSMKKIKSALWVDFVRRDRQHLPAGGAYPSLCWTPRYRVECTRNVCMGGGGGGGGWGGGGGVSSRGHDFVSCHVWPREAMYWSRRWSSTAMKLPTLNWVCPTGRVNDAKNPDFMVALWIPYHANSVQVGAKDHRSGGLEVMAIRLDSARGLLTRRCPTVAANTVAAGDWVSTTFQRQP